MGPDGGRDDAVERLRRKWDELKAAEGADPAGNVVRLPRRPRRGRDEVGEAQRRSRFPGAVDDPAPTRPVTRAELQDESGSWLVHGAAPAAAPTEHEGKVIDLGARRNKDGSVRPRVLPRRVGHDTDGEADTTPDLS